MADPEEFIEIRDFSPGIHGDYHASTGVRNTADPALKGALLGNGIARVEGTERCRADKTGALVPLPKAQIVGMRDGVGPTWNLQPNRLFRYVLDAQLGPSLVDATLTVPTPVTELPRRSTHMMWGYWVDDSDDYHPIVVGREYRKWLSLSETDSLFDFLLGDAVGEATNGLPVYPLPIGQLCDGRFYLGNTEYGESLEPSILAAGGMLTISDAADLDIVGDLAVSLRIAPQQWTTGGVAQRLISKWVFSSQQSYQFTLLGDGTLQLSWSSTGGNTINRVSTVTVASTGVADDEFKWVGATLDADNGAAGHDVRFWTSDDGDAWTQLGATVTTAGTTSIFASTSALTLLNEAGGAGLVGRATNILVGSGSGANPPDVFGALAVSIRPTNFPDNEPLSFTAFTGETVTLSGQIALVVPSNFGFKPSWMYPVTVALAATPWAAWGAGNLMRTGALTMAERYGIGVVPAFASPYAFYPPGIGLKGLGTCIIAMGWHNIGINIFPQSSVASYWYFHYSEEDNVPTQESIEGGPINPYLLVAHQGRVTMADRRRSRLATTLLSEIATRTFGHADDLVWYSDYAVPCQSPFLFPLNNDGLPTITNTAYGTYPKATMNPYNKLLIAEDDVSEIGTIGVTTVDQLLIVKHHTGGAMISGDLDNPSIRRLPYIESTGGVICKGANTPIGFVYGSNNGIYVWAGGDSTQKLSTQLDGFFWDHTNGSTEETYAGSRGRMAYWNNLVCVPNNFLYDIEAQSWWRFKVTDLLPISADIAPYNCYDKDEQGQLYAFPYRNKWPTTVSKITWPATATNVNSLEIPDAANFSAPTQLDVRFALGDTATGSTDREVIGQYETTGNQRSWSISISTADAIVFRQSTTGAVDAFTLTSSALPVTNDPLLIRVTWDSTITPNNVQFWTKSGVPEHSIAAALRANDDEWVQLGASQTGAVAALFNSTDVLRIGNRTSAFLAPLTGRFFGASVRVVPVASVTTPVVSIIPTDLPSNEAATSFTANTGQTVTVVRAGSGNQLAIDFNDHAIPVWHQFDQKVLDNEYRWASQPLLESRGRRLSFQQVQLLVTSKDDSDSTTVAITLEGFDQAGESLTTRTVTFTVGASPEPQLLKKDIEPNFNAEYVTVKIHALETDTSLPAPKIHALRLGYKDRARIVRQG